MGVFPLRSLTSGPGSRPQPSRILPLRFPPRTTDTLGVVAVPNTGIYDVAGRFSLDDGISWTYCDLDGSANGYSASTAGHVTVIP